MPQPRPSPLTNKKAFLCIGINNGFFFVRFAWGCLFSSLLEHKIKIALLRKLRSTIFISCFSFSDFLQFRILKKS